MVLLFNMNYFNFLTPVKNPATNICEKVFDWTWVFLCLGWILRVELLSLVMNWSLTFYKTAKCFPKWLPHFTFKSAMHESSTFFSTSSEALAAMGVFIVGILVRVILSPGKSHGPRSLVGRLQSMGSLRAQLSDFTFTFHFHALEKEMATHSSVLAWRIPGTGEPGGLPSMGSHRVGHDWSDLAAAAAAAASVKH